MSIEIRGLNKRFGTTVACDDLNLDIPAGELVALLGPSGCGKTTLLRIIAGLEVPDTGSVLFHGEDATNTHVRDRNVGFVFQHYALFNHMTIFENVAFGLRVRPKSTRPSDKIIREKVMKLLELVQLAFLADRYPHQLSGGQRQRIALARALAVEPKVLLLDEPFGALDAKVRKELRRWLRRLHDEVHVTSVFVTHDQEEAMEVADRVVVMNRGRIEQQGAPDEVYDRPATPFVLQFLGDVNLFHGRIGHLPGGEAGTAGAVAGAEGTDDGLTEVSFVRPHELEIVAEAGEGTWPVVLSHTLTVGPNTRIEFRREDAAGFVDVELPRDTYVALRGQLGLEPGARVHLRPRRVTRFAAAALGAAAIATSAAPAVAVPAGAAIDQRLLDYYAG
jgi:sulfate transport system ATP-binding protein